jgi:hypothetical protein
MRTTILTILPALALIPFPLTAGEIADNGLAQTRSEVRQMVSNMGRALEAETLCATALRSQRDTTTIGDQRAGPARLPSDRGDAGKPKREVITQIWQRDDDGLWRISHMHVSINDMLKPGERQFDDGA